MKRILLVHHDLLPVGGGHLVGAWFLQVLRDEYDVTLLAWRRPRFAEVDGYYGTTLAAGGFELRLIPRLWRSLVDALPVPADYLRINVMARLARRLLRRDPHDLAISTLNEMDFGQPAVQYIHFPSRLVPRPPADLRWYSRSERWLHLYRSFCERIGRGPGNLRSNVTLANSEWTAERWRSWHGSPVDILYPPAVGPFPERPWDQREEAFACIGRISADKETARVVEIVRTLRGRGRAFRLTLIGPATDRRSVAQVRRAEIRDGKEGWVDIREGLSRGALLDLLSRHRYLLHGKSDEHFGIAVAEALCCGCVPFVASGSGSAEIVAHDPRLLFGSNEGAVARIEDMVADADALCSVRERLAQRRDLFSTESFRETLLKVVGETLSRNTRQRIRGA